MKHWLCRKERPNHSSKLIRHGSRCLAARGACVILPSAAKRCLHSRRRSAPP